MEVKIDNTDKKILNVLIDDAKLSYRKIAKKTGVSVATVMNRINRLKKEGIITKYTIGVKYSKIGYDMQVIIDVRISEGRLKDAEEKIALHPNVFAVYDNTGQFDATVIAKFKNRSSLDSFLKKIQSYDFVERIETKLLLSTVKEHMIKLPIDSFKE